MEKKCRLKHVRSLWCLLSCLKSKMLCDLGRVRFLFILSLSHSYPSSFTDISFNSILCLVCCRSLLSLSKRSFWKRWRMLTSRVALILLCITWTYRTCWVNCTSTSRSKSARNRKHVMLMRWTKSGGQWLIKTHYLCGREKSLVSSVHTYEVLETIILVSNRDALV